MSDEKDDKVEIEDHGIFIIMEEIRNEICEDAIKFIMEENFKTKHEMLTLIVNSCGGSCSAGFALIDVMAGSNIPIRTVGIGELSSMGLSVFIAGKKGHRALTPNTAILSHQWMWGQFGKEHELLAGVKGFNLLSEMMINHYHKHTGLSKSDVRKYLMPPHDVHLSAKEAKKLGVCDIIREFK